MGKPSLRIHLNRSSSPIHNSRHMLSRGSSSSSSTPSNSPTRTSYSSLHNVFQHHTSTPRSSSPALPTRTTGSEPQESDAECWERMLALQMEYHCYNSARLEAAVQALESGCSIEDVRIPSRLCLDLLNEELRAQIEAQQAGLRE